MFKRSPLLLHVEPSTHTAGARTALVDVGVLGIIFMPLGAVSGSSLPTPGNNRPVTALNIHKVTDWLKMVRISAATITTKMIEFKALGQWAVKGFPEPEVSESSGCAVSGVELGVPGLGERLPPAPAPILNNDYFPEFVPVGEFVKSQSLYHINRSVSFQPASVHGTQTVLSSWLQAIRNRARVIISVWHVDKCNSYAVPCQLIQT